MSAPCSPRTLSSVWSLQVCASGMKAAIFAAQAILAGKEGDARGVREKVGGREGVTARVIPAAQTRGAGSLQCYAPSRSPRRAAAQWSARAARNSPFPLGKIPRLLDQRAAAPR